MTASTAVRVIASWRDRAACRADHVDPETFFPAAEGGPQHDAQVAQAKAVCAACPVRAECLDEALARIPYGIAGGLTADERRGRRPTGGATSSDGDVLERGLRPGARRAEVSAAGLVLLTAGRSPREVADRCGVSVETVRRWHIRHRSTQAEGSRGGNRAPLLTSHTHGTSAKDTNAERTRP